jgi:hypothetical protein
VNIAILNLSNNVSSFTTTPSGETIYFKRMFELLNHTVHIISNKHTQNSLSFEEVLDINYYDKLIVVNGPYNFYASEIKKILMYKEDSILIKNFKLMAQYKKQIYYLLTDLRLTYKQLWPSIERRGWNYKKEELYVTSPVKIISQTHNLDVVKKLIPDNECVYFPLERYKLLFNEPNVTSIKTTDLIYGGSFRSGKREKKMIDYLFDTPYSVEFYGKVELDQFKLPYTQPPLFTGNVNFNEVISKNNSAWASIIIGDKLYNNNHITLRVWEVMMSDSVILIDNEFDPEHKIMGKDWFYVNNKQDIQSKLQEIKQHHQYIIQYQHNRINELFNKQQYLNQLEDLINDN